MEVSSRDFCKLTVQEAADILMEKLESNDRDYSCAKLHGCNQGRLFELCIVMREADNNG